jgi:hypothetical protein
MFLGFPVKEFEYSHTENENIWLNEQLIPSFLAKGWIPTHRSQMSYAIPAWLTGKQDNPMILFLDDFTRANISLLQSTMTIIDEGKYISWSLPKGSSVILSSNPDGGDFLVTSMDDAQKSRYLETEMKFDVDSWASDFAEPYKLDGRCVNFVLKNPEIVEGVKDMTDDGKKIIKANIRLWTKYFDTIGGIDNWEQNINMLMNLGGCLPQEHLLLFVQFINNKLDRLPQPKQLLDNDKQWVMNELTSLIGKDISGRRQDLAAILMKRLVNYVIVNEKDMNKDNVKRVGDILESELFTKDLVHISFRKLIMTQKFKGLVGTHPKLLEFYK